MKQPSLLQRVGHNKWRQERINSFFLQAKERFFLMFPAGFLSARPPSFMERVLLAVVFFKKKLEQTPQGELSLLARPIKGVVKLPFKERKVLAIAIVLKRLEEWECLGFEQIVLAIQSLVETALVIKDSFVTALHSHDTTQTMYLEIEKRGEADFSQRDFYLLKTQLAFELRKRIATLSPSLFSPQNVEELYRNMLLLGGTMQQKGELPKALISFSSQEGDKLIFQVVLLFAVTKDEPSSPKTLKESEVRFIHVKKAALGTLPEGYQKEAHVFSAEIKNTHFLKEDHSVDLLKARKFLARAIKKNIGPFADAEGEKYQKQDARIKHFIHDLGPLGKANTPLLDRFFGALFPLFARTFLPEELLLLFAKFFLKQVNASTPFQEAYYFKEELLVDGAKALFVKSHQKGLMQKILDCALETDFTSFRYAYVYLKVQEATCLCFLQLPPHTTSKCAELKEQIALFEKKQRQVLYLPLSGLPNTIDPHTSIDRRSRILQHAVYETLTRVAPCGKVEGACARLMEFSQDGKRVIFRLRRCFWSNKERVTAFDFEWGWKKALSPHSDCLKTDLFYPIKNAEAVRRGELPLDALGVKAIDERTLVVELAHFAPYFLRLVSNPLFAPLYRGHSGKELEVGNGPFMVDSWSEEKEIVLAKNPNYWDKEAVTLEKIVFMCVKSHEKAFTLFEEGKIDWVGKPMTNIPLDKVASLKAEEKLVIKPISEVFWLCCNLQKFPLCSKHFRRALGSALSRKKLAQEVFIGELPTQSLLPHEMALHAKEPLYPDGDTAYAVKELACAFDELKVGLNDLPPLEFSHTNSPVQKKIAAAIKKQWERALGIKVELKEYGWKQFSANLGAKEYCIGGCLFDSVYADPICTLKFFSDKSMAYNVPGWSSEKYNEWLNLAEHEELPSVRREYLTQAERLLMEEMPIIPIYSEQIKYMTKKGVKGITITPSGQIDFKWAKVEERHA